jgi:putative endonuclease|tara:strand:- start:179 stop:478 length:300 start_codon:yes stop_codon:yes gene_type:complete
MEKRHYYAYIMASKSRTIYTGITNELQRRVWEHKQKVNDGFTKRYNITKLVYFAETDDVIEAIAFEKRIKGWTRKKKVALIEERNSKWLNLAADWYDEE